LKVTIHQPLHFPYLGFFQKMKAADLFVVLDDAKFSKNEFYNRNKFRNKAGQDEWFTVPVEKKANSKLINEVRVSKDPRWRKKLIRQMKMNFGYDFTSLYRTDQLCQINIQSIQFLRSMLGVKTPMTFASEMHLKTKKTQRLVDICEEVGATHYISGPHGENYLDEPLFGDIAVSYFQPDVPDYYTALTHI